MISNKIYTVIVVPCYNEAFRLQEDAFVDYLQRNEHVNFLFIDDGSTDSTVECLRRLASRSTRISWLHNSANLGKAESVRRGLLHAMDMGADYAGFWDADLATPLQEIGSFIEILESKERCEMVFGARVNLLGRNNNRSPLRHYLSRVFATVVANMLGLSIYDSQCGAKVFRVNDLSKSIFSEPFISKWIFDVEIIARVIRQCRDPYSPRAKDIIVEHPLSQWTEVGGSKLQKKDFYQTLPDLVRIYNRYLR